MSEAISFGDKINRHLTQAEARATGRRYCTSCNKSQQLDNGLKLRYRWICAGCRERRAQRLGREVP